VTADPAAIRSIGRKTHGRVIRSAICPNSSFPIQVIQELLGQMVLPRPVSMFANIFFYFPWSQSTPHGQSHVTVDGIECFPHAMNTETSR
jgi:hypothetical protein